MTVGLANARRRVRRSEPNVHAVLAVKVGKQSELSMTAISSSTRGGSGMTGSVAMSTVDARVRSLCKCEGISTILSASRSFVVEQCGQAARIACPTVESLLGSRELRELF